MATVRHNDHDMTMTMATTSMTTMTSRTNHAPWQRSKHNEEERECDATQHDNDEHECNQPQCIEEERGESQGEEGKEECHPAQHEEEGDSTHHDKPDEGHSIQPNMTRRTGTQPTTMRRAGATQRLHQWAWLIVNDWRG